MMSEITVLLQVSNLQSNIITSAPYFLLPAQRMAEPDITMYDYQNRLQIWKTTNGTSLDYNKMYTMHHKGFAHGSPLRTGQFYQYISVRIMSLTLGNSRETNATESTPQDMGKWCTLGNMKQRKQNRVHISRGILHNYSVKSSAIYDM